MSRGIYAKAGITGKAQLFNFILKPPDAFSESVQIALL